MLRPSTSVKGCFAMTHKLPNGEIGSALMQRRTKGWQMTFEKANCMQPRKIPTNLLWRSGTVDVFFDTLQELLESKSLLFPKAGEEGSPGKMTN